MDKTQIKDVVIVGGGTAGWMTALALVSVLSPEKISVTLIESDQIGTVGVGEATIPEIALYNDLVGINENEFLSFTNGTFKLGIEFINWGAQGQSYMHPFGSLGFPVGNIPFHQHWQRLFLETGHIDIGHYSIAQLAAKANKFCPASNAPQSALSNIDHAYHFDATLYAKYLRQLAEQRGVKRIEGKVNKTNLCPQSGNIESVVLENKLCIAGQLFIDCSGFRALLIEGALNTGFDDWSHLLPCNKAVTIATKNTEEPIPYTQSIAHQAGWQWRIPLQNRVGNGHVYCDKYMSQEQATSILLNNISGELLGEPKHLSFTTGMRKKFWHKNCVAIGLSSGFMEPLESTSIHLIQTSIFRLLDLFPVDGINPIEVDKFNELLTNNFVSIRDFLILHYHVNQRTQDEFWQYCKQMTVPESLSRKIEIYQNSGRIFRNNNELFSEDGWLSVMHGQGLRANSSAPSARNFPLPYVEQNLAEIYQIFQQTVSTMPSHSQYINKHCKAGS